jgi:hypothetical protein
MPEYFKVTWIHSGGPLVEEEDDGPPPTAKFKYSKNEAIDQTVEITEFLRQFFKARNLPFTASILYVRLSDDRSILEWTDSEYARP